MSPRISAVILTLNEERNIANALRSVVAWVDEIVVVDMYSDDRTVEIAKSFGAKVFSHPRTGFIEPARAFAVSQATGDWIINLDADEIVPVELSRELVRIAAEDSADICSLPFLNYIGGGALLNSGWGPDQDRHDRFFCKGALEFSSRVHASAERAAGAKVVKMDARPGLCILHFNYLNSGHFLNKLNRYTDIEAQQAFERGERASLKNLLLRPIAAFVKRYVFLHGFRDGWNGFYYSFLMLVYKLTVATKLRELERYGSSDDVRKRYQEIADSCLREYEDAVHTPSPSHISGL